MADQERKAFDRVREIVSDTLEGRLEELHVISVEVEEAYDADGDPILHVSVVYETEQKELDGWKLSGFVRHLRPALSECGEDRFPVMSFIAAEEYAATR